MLASDMPTFTLYDHNYSSDVAAVKKTQLALSKPVTLTLARKTMAEYLSHHLRQEEDYTSEPLFWTSRTASPLVIASIILSSIALIFTILLGAKLRAVSLLLLSVRHTSAIPTHLSFFYTTPSPLTLATYIPEQMTSYDIFLLTALVIIALALIVMACFACSDHCNRPPFP